MVLYPWHQLYTTFVNQQELLMVQSAAEKENVVTAEGLPCINKTVITSFDVAVSMWTSQLSGPPHEDSSAVTDKNICLWQR
jgi:hypothetical protein